MYFVFCILITFLTKYFVFQIFFNVFEHKTEVHIRAGIRYLRSRMERKTPHGIFNGVAPCENHVVSRVVAAMYACPQRFRY